MPNNIIIAADDFTVSKEFLKAMAAEGAEFRVHDHFRSPKDFREFISSFTASDPALFTVSVSNLTARVTMMEAFRLQAQFVGAPAPLVPLYKGEVVSSRVHLIDLGLTKVDSLMAFYSRLLASRTADKLVAEAKGALLLMAAGDQTAAATALEDIQSYIASVAGREHEVDHDYQRLYDSIFSDKNPALAAYIRQIDDNAPQLAAPNNGPVQPDNGAIGVPAVIAAHLGTGRAVQAPELPKLGDLIKNQTHLNAMASALFEGVIAVATPGDIGVVSRVTHSAAKTQELIDGIRRQCVSLTDGPKTVVFKSVLPGYSAEVETFTDGSSSYVVVKDRMAPEGYVYYGPSGPEAALDRKNIITFVDERSSPDVTFILPGPCMDTVAARFSTFAHAIAEDISSIHGASALLTKTRQFIAETGFLVSAPIRELGLSVVHDEDGSKYAVKSLQDDAVIMRVQPITDNSKGELTHARIEVQEFGVVEEYFDLEFNFGGAAEDMAALKRAVEEIGRPYQVTVPAPRLH